jgi:hypothetical protein
VTFALLLRLTLAAASALSTYACSPPPGADDRARNGASVAEESAPGASAVSGRAEGGARRGRAAGAEESAPSGSAIQGRGWVIWESDRSGSFRIWRQPIEGGAAEQLSPDEQGRDHCCGHLSPDGAWVIYLSLPGGTREYLPAETSGELHLVSIDGGRDRVVAPAARSYGGHRAAMWWSEDSLVFIDGAGDTRHLDLSSGAQRTIVDGPERGEGFLVDPTGRWATSSTATFSSRDPESGEVRVATPFGGCEAWLAADGRTGVWTAGAGGPIDAIDLETRATWTILRKHDPRLPRDRGYMYFPMLSHDRTLLAVAASNDVHDHFRADYDVLVVELDPSTLQPVADAWRVTAHPSVDRYPDVWRDPASAPRRTAPAARPPTAQRAAAEGWPAAPAGLAWIWEGAERPNRRAPDAASELLDESGETWIDRRGRLALAGGFATADPESARRLIEELKASNTVTIEMVLEPAALGAGTSGPILALAAGARRGGIHVAQAGDRIELGLRTSDATRGTSPVVVARLPGAGAHHVAFSYSPGRLRTYLDGQPEASPPLTGDFFKWRAGELTLGAAGGGPERFRGFLSHVAIFARELSADEIAADADRALGALAATPAVPRAAIEGVLEARARVPALAEISPYRRALVIERWRVERVVSGELGGGQPTHVRVARWALVDGGPASTVALAPGARATLELEPYDAQPQLESVFLSRDDPAGEGPLWFDVGWGAGS